MKSKAYNLLKFLIGWPLSIVALFFIFKLISPQAETILSNLNKINPTLLFYGVMSFIIFYFIRSYIWYRLMKRLNHDLSFRNSCYMWAISELKRYVPGSIWAFLGRTVLFAEKGVAKKDIAKSLLIEAELFVIGCAIISILALPFLFPGLQLQFNTSSGFLISITAIIVIAAYIFFHTINNKWEVIHGKLNFLFPPYKPSENFLLVLLSTAALFFFGLGNFLVIGSYVPLHPQMILELIGFFVLSFLVGYLSVLTPAGFGVREGIMIYGLSKVTTSAIAAFAAIFSRILLIVSELIFIALALLWHNLKKWKMGRTSDSEGARLLDKGGGKWKILESWLSTHPHELIVGFLATMYTLYIATASFLRYDNYYTGRFDLGNMAQTVWNTMHGRIFLFTNPNATEQISRMAFHADFILILLAPFYALWTNPKMLLLIQTAVVAAGAIFVFLIGNHILKNKNLSLVFAFAYLINPSVQRANLYDFHAVVLATTFFLATYFFYLKKRYILFIIFGILAAICKEQLWVILALFGGLLIIRQKKFLMGISLAVVSIAMFYYLVWHAMPSALGSHHFALSFYSGLGDGPTGVVKAILFSPDKILAIVTEHGRVEYLKKLFSPLGYLPLFAPFFLIFAGPDFAINLLSSNTNFQQIYYQYTATITPFLFISAIWGVWVIQYLSLRAQSRNLIPPKYRGVRSLHFLRSVGMTILVAYIVISALNAAYNFGPLPGSKSPNIDMLIKPIEERAYVDQYLSEIPEDYRIAASNNLGSHLSHREHIYVVPNGLEEADIITLLLTDTWSIKRDKELVQKLKSDPNYELIAEHNRFYAFKRK